MEEQGDIRHLVQVPSLVAKAARVCSRGLACFVRKDFCKNNVYKNPSQQSASRSSATLLFMYILFLFAGRGDQPGFQGQPLGLCE